MRLDSSAVSIPVPKRELFFFAGLMTVFIFYLYDFNSFDPKPFDPESKSWNPKIATEIL